MSKPSKDKEIAEFKDRLATAKAHRRAERMEAARAEYAQALAYAEQHFGPDSVQVDEVCLEQAIFHAELKEPEAELAALERRVRIRKADAGIPQIVDALQDLAECHKTQDRPELAEATYREALALCDEWRGTEHYFGSRSSYRAATLSYINSNQRLTVTFYQTVSRYGSGGNGMQKIGEDEF